MDTVQDDPAVTLLFTRESAFQNEQRLDSLWREGRNIYQLDLPTGNPLR